METQVQIINPNELNAQVMSALELHNRIRTAGEQAAVNYVDFCKCLKEMRDRELYTELGFESFDAYTAGTLGMKQRQAYYYISQYERLGVEFLSANAQLGVKKLSLLASISPEDRDEVMKTGEVWDMSTAELKRVLGNLEKAEADLAERDDRIEELNSRLERLELDSNAVDDGSDQESELDALREENKRLIKEAETAKKTSSPDMDRLIADAVEKQRKAMEKEAQKAAEMNAADKIEQARNKAKDEAEAEVKKAQAEAQAAKAELAKIDVIRADLKEEQERREKLEKELTRSANPQLTKFKFMAEQAQAQFNAMVALLADADAETQAKCRIVITKLAEGVIKAVAV